MLEQFQVIYAAFLFTFCDTRNQESTVPGFFSKILNGTTETDSQYQGWE